MQVFVPGFTVRELPVDLTNINNVQYRADGTLVALGYNGDVYLLRDTDGDGVEDKADAVLGEQGAARGRRSAWTSRRRATSTATGVFVAAKGKVSLIVDTDGDGKADKEIVVAEGGRSSARRRRARRGGRPEGRQRLLRPRHRQLRQRVPARQGRQGPVTTSTASAAPSCKVSPGLQEARDRLHRHPLPGRHALQPPRRPVRTDQEGATWLPNGNPFDELLHIQKGRHYGFPPRHPKHLPDVIDEPSTFDYGPQHQSTCGFSFNEPVNGRPDVRPEGVGRRRDRDGRVARQAVPHAAGEDARRLRRAEPTVRVPEHAHDRLLRHRRTATCVVACHSGGPDWGSGPTGKGKLYKISYDAPTNPQPVAGLAGRAARKCASRSTARSIRSCCETSRNRR